MPSVRVPSRMRVHATCAGEMPVSATFMKRKLEPHTIPASTNWTAIQRGEGRRVADAAGVVDVEVTGPRYARSAVRVAVGGRDVRNPPTCDRPATVSRPHPCQGTGFSAS
ncbi:hypothetical protein GCM10025774_30940 [Microbacterium kyungheense]